VRVAERPDERDAAHLLALDEFALEELNQRVAGAGMEGVLAELDDAAHRALAKSMTQLVSQASPPSGEKACSQRHDAAVMRDQRKRTLIGLPSRWSSAKNVPIPPVNRPIIGTSSRCA